MTPKTHITYRKLDLIAVPESITELGVEAGELGVVGFVYAGGRGLHGEISRGGGTTVGFVQFETDLEANAARS
ncbi:MAG: hypothetical protein ACR2GU_03370 [Rubrobacteraceae bacterium]